MSLVLALVSMAAPANAQDSSLYAAAPIGLHLRSGPSLSASIIDLMPYGSSVEAMSQTSGAWQKVKFNQNIGWAYSDWLSPEPVQALSSQTSGGYAQGSMEGIIREAAARYGVDGDWLLAVAICESSLNPSTVGPNGEIGLFQFMESTYWGYGGQGDIWNPYNQADLAARMFSQGLSYHWTCAR